VVPGRQPHHRALVEESTRRKSQGAPLRKSARVFVEVPIRVRGAGAGGAAFDERSSIVTQSLGFQFP
jgi:hypothetical protein